MKVDGSIDGFATLLGKTGFELGAEEMADVLWLAGHITTGDRGKVIEEGETEEESTEPTVQKECLESEPENDDQLPLSLPPKQNRGSTKSGGISIKVPAAPALRIRLELARALRPLRRRVPSPVRMEFNQAATIERIADQRIWSPVLSPAPERWLEVALVIEESKSAPLWKETLAEFQTLLERQGAFRNVSPWRLRSDDTGELTLLSQKSSRPRSVRELLDPAGRRLILLVSDCTSVAWQRGTIYLWLEIWGEKAPTTVIQLLPERLWTQTGLVHGVPVWLSTLEPGVPSARMIAMEQIPLWDLLGATQEQVVVPVVSLETEPLKQWAKVVSGAGENRTVGFRFEKRELAPSEIEGEEQPELSAEDRVKLFRATASMTAQKLAGLMSAAPVDPPIVNLIRQTMLPEAKPVHVAEVYMGGLIEVQADGKYDFIAQVRKILASSVSMPDTEKIFDIVSIYISKRIGLNILSFEALLSINVKDNDDLQEIILPFAKIVKQLAPQMRGDYYEHIQDSVWMNNEKQLKKSPEDSYKSLEEDYKALQAEYETLKSAQKNLENELSEAAAYVRSLLPRDTDKPPVKIQTRFLECKKLGGDCFDFYWLDPDYLVMYLLDVSGYGLSSALLSVSILNVLRSQSLPGTNFYRPDKVLESLNKMFQMNDQSSKYFTIWYGIYNRINRQLMYASAGHPPAVLVFQIDGNSESTDESADRELFFEAVRLQTPGIPIGMMPDTKYTWKRCSIPEDSYLYVFSDGVYEINVPHKEIDVANDDSKISDSLDTFVEHLLISPRPGNLDTIIKHATSAGNNISDDISILEIDFG